MAIFTELQQVVLNFVINAEQAIVHADCHSRAASSIRTGDRDGWAWIEVEDSGPGVPAEHEAKLFQPFYTTKPVGEGTGLGLSVSYDIIRSHNGRIGYRRGAIGRRGVLLRTADRAARSTDSMTQRIYYTEPYRRIVRRHRRWRSIPSPATSHVIARSDRVLSDIRRPAVRHRHARRRRGDRRHRSRRRHASRTSCRAP